ncbi:MAG: hypothetical protein JO208_11355 [Alphaproteobacteria bacterium]|nr:hypothetical protein [Alphaproteobacteria bacterium]
MIRIVSIAQLLASAALALSLPLAPARAVTITSFDVPGAAFTTAVSINSTDSTTGTYANPGDVCTQHGFVRHPDGSLDTFDAQGEPDTVVATIPGAINDAGTVGGVFWESSTDCQTYLGATGFMRSAAGVIREFALPWNFTFGGMNNPGTIVGTYSNYGDYRNLHALIHSAGDQTTTFNVPGADATYAYSINDAGFVTGISTLFSTGEQHGYIRDPDGNFTTFDVPNAIWTFPRAINNANEVTGSYAVAQDGNSHGFIRAADGSFTFFDVRRGTGIDPVAINSLGSVTGNFNDTRASRQRGFVRGVRGHIVKFDPPGSTYTQSVAINRHGDVTGYYVDSNNVQHGYVRVR